MKFLLAVFLAGCGPAHYRASVPAAESVGQHFTVALDARGRGQVDFDPPIASPYCRTSTEPPMRAVTLTPAKGGMKLRSDPGITVILWCREKITP
jgi:hypothetical protein